jgi:molybdate transport system ATP-binding protein
VSLDLDISCPLGRITLDVRTSIGEGFTAVVGPSGAGKTSLLNVIAGLRRPATGHVHWRDDIWVDTERRVYLPPHRRRVGYVFQEPRLFPHLNVRHNLTFASWFTRDARAGRVPFDDVVSLLGLEPLLARSVTRLSGGEMQRVAIARALLADPQLLLLDEPLASVDVARRFDVLPYLDRLRDELKLPTIYVTHTWGEVEGRATAVLRLEEGRLTTRADAPHDAAAPARAPASPGST